MQDGYLIHFVIVEICIYNYIISKKNMFCILIKYFLILETQRPPSKRRKRKSSAANSGVASTGGKKKNLSPGPPNFTLASQVWDFSGVNFYFSFTVNFLAHFFIHRKEYYILRLFECFIDFHVFHNFLPV